MQKLIKSQKFYLLSISLALILLAEITFKDFFHNHEADFHEHEDCPVLVLDQSLNTGIVVTFDYQAEFSFIEIENKFSVPSYFAEVKKQLHLRSPPII